MSIDGALKRYWSGLIVAGLATAAYLQALGFNWLISTALLNGAPRRQPTPVESLVAHGEEKPPPPKPAPPVPPPLATPPDPLSWPDCQDVQVVIVSESKDPDWSLTTIREAGQTQGRARRVGDGVAGKQVAFIGYNPKAQAPSVWLEGGGTFCQSLLFRPSLPTAAPPTPQLPRPPENPLSLLRSLRVVPEQKDGSIVGLRLFGIRPGSLFESLGVKNGDRLESINGLSMTTPEKALEAYAKLRTAERLDVRLERRGQPVELTLTLK